MDSPFINENGENIPFDKVGYNHLIQLADFEEGWKFEYKVDYDKSVQRKLSKSICSFANCAGGWMFIGIENNTHNVVDVEKPNGEIELNIINAIKPFVDLEIPNLLRAKFLENPTNAGYGVIMIGVQEGLHPPYVSNGAIYVRAGAQSDPVPAERATIDYLYKKSDRTSVLSLKALNAGKVKSLFSMHTVSKHRLFNDTIKSLRQEIEKLIEQNNKLLSATPSSEPAKDDLNDLPFSLGQAKLTIQLARGKEIDLFKSLENEYKRIKEYIDVFNISCSVHNLFSFGNLKIYHNSILGTTTPVGTTEEKDRYEAIIQINDKIQELVSIMPLGEVSPYIYSLDLAISNEGNYYDEDITLCLCVPKGSFYNFAQLRINSVANKYNKILMETTAINAIPDVDDYDKYGRRTFATAPIKMVGLGQIVEDKEEELKTDIENELDYLYSPFEIVNLDERTDVIKVKFNKLNPNQIKRLPAQLFFNCELSEIPYSIISKYSIKRIESVIKGVNKLHVNN